MEIKSTNPLMQHMNLTYVKRLVMDNVQQIRVVNDEGFRTFNDDELDDVKQLIIDKGEFVELAMSEDEEDQLAAYYVGSDYYRCFFNKDEEDDEGYPIMTCNIESIIKGAKARLNDLEKESLFLQNALLELGANTNEGK